MSSAEKPEYFSVEQYLAAEDPTQPKCEYIDGWIRAMSGSMLRHNRVKLNCLVQLSLKLSDKKSSDNSCQPYDSDTKLRIFLDGHKRFYYPDAQVVCDGNEQTAVFQERPSLLIEVLSPATRRYDLDEKMSAYLTIPSLQCYLVLEQHQPIAIVMRRTANGFIREEIKGIDASIHLPFLDCSLAMRVIYAGVQFTAECVNEPEVEYEVMR